jgi:hypothetical protein
MKRILLLALMLNVSACGAEKGSPTAPSSALRKDSSSPAASGALVPFHILHPVEFQMSQGLVIFPPRTEPNAFFQDLQALYRGVLGRPQTAPTYVDPEGQNVWLTEYFRFYLNGCSHVDAMSRTLTEVTTGGSLPTCGSETLTFPPRNLPNEFQNRLEATYRDAMQRPLLSSYVDSEGANVWLAQYLRFRVSGCNHIVAQDKVFTEIRGGGVQPACLHLSGAWTGTYGQTLNGAQSMAPVPTATLSQSGAMVTGTFRTSGTYQGTFDGTLTSEFTDARISGTLRVSTPSTNGAVICQLTGTFTGTPFPSFTVTAPVLVSTNCTGTITNATLALTR